MVGAGSPSGSTVVFRPAIESDRTAIRVSIDLDFAGTPYAEVVGYFLRLALDDRGDESRAIVAAQHGEVVGTTLFGAVAGALGVGRMHYIGVTASARRQGIGVALCEAAIADMASKGARLVIAEVPDEGALAGGRALLNRVGFLEIARVADYYRDGVDLLIMRHSAETPRNA